MLDAGLVLVTSREGLIIFIAFVLVPVLPWNTADRHVNLVTRKFCRKALPTLIACESALFIPWMLLFVMFSVFY